MFTIRSEYVILPQNIIIAKESNRTNNTSIYKYVENISMYIPYNSTIMHALWSISTVITSKAGNFRFEL
jgi:hypothetical protein